MAKVRNLIDQEDSLRAQSISDETFEKTWGRSLDRQVDKMMGRWNEFQAQAKKTIEENKQA